MQALCGYSEGMCQACMHAAVISRLSSKNKTYSLGSLQHCVLFVSCVKKETKLK